MIVALNLKSFYKKLSVYCNSKSYFGQESENHVSCPLVLYHDREFLTPRQVAFSDLLVALIVRSETK